MSMTRPGNVAIVDTTCPTILLNSSLTEEIYKTIPGSNYSKLDQGWIFPNTTNTFPNLTLPVGSTEITLQHPSDFSIGPAETDGFLFGSIQSNGNLGLDVFGVPWLNNVYAVFDLGMAGVGRFRLGVAQRPPQCM
jgi:hypothetical protein